MLRDDEPETSRVDPARGVPGGSEAVDGGHADRDGSGGGRSSSNGTAAKHVIIIFQWILFWRFKNLLEVGPFDGDFDKHGFFTSCLFLCCSCFSTTTSETSLRGEPWVYAPFWYFLSSFYFVKFTKQHLKANFGLTVKFIFYRM